MAWGSASAGVELLSTLLTLAGGTDKNAENDLFAIRFVAIRALALRLRRRVRAMARQITLLAHLYAVRRRRFVFLLREPL
ncbi:MAG: hypothetical protein LBB58_02280 [Cellulomonadaceae bacterium]|nr:hypothetical protein [Cellulomonadaceae bacterium]